MAPIHPLYVPKDSEQQIPILSSLTVLRTLDNETFLASVITDKLVKDRDSDEVNTSLAQCLLPSVSTAISRILNHPNIISLIDIQPITAVAGSIAAAGPDADITVWEDMNAGSLAIVLPSMDDLPDFGDRHGWYEHSRVDHCRFSLPECLCWHVLRNISKALLWLHYGVKETDGISDEWQKHDEDWQAILIRDISPGQIWFKKPNGHETYGQCKLGGFAWAKVTGAVGPASAYAEPHEPASREKRFFWAPEIYNNKTRWSRASEIWSLGAVLYFMMVGIPPPRAYEYEWQISRLNDKGFSPQLRELVAAMMHPRLSARPDALMLVNKAQEGWRSWRATTREGKEYVDGGDKALGEKMERSRLGPERVGGIGAL